VRELVGDDLEALVRAQIRIAKGLAPVEAPGLEIKAGDVTRAFDSLMDRGWGKPKQAIELSGEVGTGEPPVIDWDGVPLEEKRELLELALRLGALGDAADTEH
jgi:hypothetical protein